MKPSFESVLSLGLLAFVVSASSAGCGDNTFDCGDNGGTCNTADEVCLLNNGCSTCVPLTRSCDGEASCGCLVPAETAEWDTPCTDVSSCDDSDDGVTLDCPSEEWGCG